MSENANFNAPSRNSHGARGIFAAVAIVLAIILLLAIFGSLGSGTQTGAPTQDAISPAAPDTTLPTD